MGHVIHFDTYKRTGKLLLLTKTCKLPWHRTKYVKDDKCLRCNVYVRYVWHPSFKKARYRG